MPDAMEAFIDEFKDRWVSANTSSRTPNFGKRHDYKIVDTNRQDFVLFYPYADEQFSRNAFGYASFDQAYFLSIELWTSFGDEHSFLMREETIRIMNVLRLDATSMGFTIADQPRIKDFRDNYRKIFRWDLEYELTRYNRQIST